MKKKERVIALIPARGGSKGIAKKNLAQLLGKPLIEYAISAALGAELVDEVWVSSDDEEILSISINLGVNVHKRPMEYATDEASPTSVVENFIEYISAVTPLKNFVLVYLQPTSPLRTSSHIDACLQLLDASEADSVLSVTVLDKSPYKSFKLNEKGQLNSLFDEHLTNSRRQDLPTCYYPNGAIYVFRNKKFMEHKGFPSNGGLPYVMHTSESLDIDNIKDLIKAEKLLREKND